MSHIFKGVTILVALSTVGLVSCYEPEKYEAPEVPAVNFKPLEGLDYDSFYQVCDQKDEQMPLLSEASNEVYRVEGEVEMQDYEVHDCKDPNKVLKTGNGPAKDFTTRVEIAPPKESEASYERVVVKNSRTCSLASRMSDAYLKNQPKSISDDQFQEALKTLPGPRLNFKNELSVPITTATDFDLTNLNVAEGKNVLEIIYEGKCLQEEKSSDGKTSYCAKYEVLARKAVLIDFVLKKTPISGVRKIETCKEK